MSKFLIGDIYVPNEIPTEKDACKIIAVGESPGEDEEIDKRPFIGKSGQLLRNTFLKYGLAPPEIGYANLCNFRPQANKFELLKGSRQLESGQQNLISELKRANPVVIAALGAQPLEFLTGRRGITAWRGSILPCSIPGLEHIKVIPTYHPAYILREGGSYPVFSADLKRMRGDIEFRELNYPVYETRVIGDSLYAEHITRKLLSGPSLVASDIETVMSSRHILCAGFCAEPGVSYVFPWTQEFIPFIRRIYDAEGLQFCFHFGHFDAEQLWLNGAPVRRYVHDTMNMINVLEPELPRSLAFLTSIYTRQPYYKASGRSELPADGKAWSEKRSKTELYNYNGTDCTVTYDIAITLLNRINTEKRETYYNYRIASIDMALNIGRTGLPINANRRAIIRNALISRWVKLQAGLNVIVGEDVNVKSPKLKTILYEKYKLPKRYNRTPEGSVLTVDEDAIVSLIGFVKKHLEELKTEKSKREWNTKLAVLTAILKIRAVRQLLSNYINIGVAEDGRIHSTYKVPSTDTHRWACEKYVDGSGFNAQTLPRDPIPVTEEDLAYEPNEAELFETQKMIMETYELGDELEAA